MIGLASWGLLPASIGQTRGGLRGKNGWFSEREEKILINRLLRDDPSKGDMNNRQAVNLQRLWKAFSDYDLWPLYLVGLTTYVPPQPPQNYLSFILRQMGFSTFEANLLTIPSQFLFGVNVSLTAHAWSSIANHLSSSSSFRGYRKSSMSGHSQPAWPTSGFFPGSLHSWPSGAVPVIGSDTPYSPVFSPTHIATPSWCPGTLATPTPSALEQSALRCTTCLSSQATSSG